MTNQEAIRILSDLHDQCCQADSVFCTDVTGARCDAVDMAISALQAQDSKTRKICDTCKHDPPSKKWPCVDCDMREPADRWEPKDVPDTNVGDMISKRAVLDILYLDPGIDEIREKMIKELPSAQPEPHWIPVSERLPESKAAYYIVTLESRDRICVLPNDIDIARWDYDRRKGKDSWHWCKERKVIAWMPLPEPYNVNVEGK